MKTKIQVFCSFVVFLMHIQIGYGQTICPESNSWVNPYCSSLKIMGPGEFVATDCKVIIGINKFQFAKDKNYTLAVAGSIGAAKVEVKSGLWPDYVFANNYKLKTLKEVESFIVTNNHLPDVPCAKTVKENGIDLGAMDAILLQKIEELTLYMIAQDKKIDSLNAIVCNIKR